jgi:hypothetical protein
MVLNDTNDEKEEIQARILAANKAYSSLQSIFRSKQIHRNQKIRLYKTLTNIKLRKCHQDPNANYRTDAEHI